MPADTITTLEELDAIYGTVSEPARLKEIDHVNAEYGRMIEASPFVVLATAGPEGLDCSPRGDPNGFVRIADRKTLLIPDRRGNNRVDSLRNIVRDPRIALLFLIPGVGETLRVNGRASLSRDEALRESFAFDGKLPACVVVVAVESVYPQCPKALVRSQLWDPARHVPRSELPSMGQMMQAASRGRLEAQSYDAAFPDRVKQTLY